MKARTIPQICRAAGISERMYFLAQEVRGKGVPELIQSVHEGVIRLHLAAQICRFPHGTQHEILAEFETLSPRQRTHMLRLMLQATTT